MITITAPEKATQQHCKWLRPRGLEGCILQVPPSVVKLRHAKVVVDSIHGRNQWWHAFVPYRIFWCFFSPERTLWRNNIGGVLMACFVVAVVPDSVAVVVCRSSASGRVGT